MPTFTQTGSDDMGDIDNPTSICRFSQPGTTSRLMYLRVTFTDITSDSTAVSSANMVVRIFNLRDPWKNRTILTGYATGLDTGNDFDFVNRDDTDQRFVLGPDEGIVCERTADNVGNTQWLLEAGLDPA